MLRDGLLPGVEFESSVHMRLYSMSKRQFVVVFLVFFICFGLSILIGLAGPPVITMVQHNATTLYPQPKDLKRGPFLLRSPTLSTYHQQLWLTAIIVTDNVDGSLFHQTFVVSMKLKAEEAPSAAIGSEKVVQNRTRDLGCQIECQELVLLHLGFINADHYLVIVEFHGLDKIKFNILDVKFYFRSYNPNFTQLEIWFRFVFVVLTFIATCVFAHSLRRFAVRNWSIEQKWMSILLPLLLLYNDPIFPVSFLVINWAPGLLDGTFQATFLCALLLFWLCIYHGVRQNQRPFMRFYLPKLILIGILWLFAIILSFWHEYNELQDPSYNYIMDTSDFTSMKIFFLIIGMVYITYLMYLLVRAYIELQTMSYFNLRLKFTTFLMVIVIAISLGILFKRFGGGIFKDDYISNLTARYNDSAEFLAFYGLLNFYLYTMAFVYSPSQNAVYETHFKDNPALSMLNDSDEEVIYDNDNEEALGLTRITRKYDSDDSR